MKTFLAHARLTVLAQLPAFALALVRRYTRGAAYRPACGHCPHWIFQGSVPRPQNITVLENGAMVTKIQNVMERVGVCALDQAKIYNDFTTGFALKAWTSEDHCSRHPLYNKRPVAGSDLVMDPSSPETQKFGGFNRLPSFAEAMKMAVAQHEKVASAPEPIFEEAHCDDVPRLVMGGETVPIHYTLDNAPDKASANSQ